jgi:tetratricopeptide (TPR) repeat protein
MEGDEANAAGVIWQARILLQSGELPKNPSDPDDLLKELIERSRSRELSAKSLSPAQGAWAGLVLAEIKLHRGDNAEADKVLAEAKVNRPSDWLFSEMLADILIRLGKNKEAGAEATKASETWPGRAKPRITLALVALLDGDPEGAIEILEDLEEVESLAEALIVRGRANLTLGVLDKAVTDLDKALSMRSREAMPSLPLAALSPCTTEPPDPTWRSPTPLRFVPEGSLRMRVRYWNLWLATTVALRRSSSLPHWSSQKAITQKRARLFSGPLQSTPTHKTPGWGPLS